MENRDPGMVCGSSELRIASEHVDCGAVQVTAAFMSPGVTFKGGRTMSEQVHSRKEYEM